MKRYDSTKPTIYIEYLDINTLLVWAMSAYLHFDEFKWLKNVDKFKE